MPTGGSRSARGAQVAAQLLTAWALALAILSRPALDLTTIFVMAYTLLAVVLPFRHDGTPRDRAVACFAAGMVLVSALGFQMVGIVVGGFRMTPTQWSVLGAVVLYSLAGTLHWIRRDTMRGTGRTSRAAA